MKLSTLLIASSTIFLLFAGCKKNDDKTGENSNSDVQKPNSEEKPNSNTKNKNQVSNGFDSKPSLGTKAWCPVMKNEFTVTEKTEMSKYKGKYYAFCCGGCKPKFDKEPEKFIKMIKAKDQDGS
ncbi:MAG: YHS domain-containing protein [Deltaproteobacteria bacterium]|jgi:YHS domain-containing protein|nr:YHS domain-containing protein [Deltaproteobacteria bacterium]